MLYTICSKDAAILSYAHLHRLHSVLLKLLNVLFDQNHLLLEERRFLFQSLYIPQHSGHILERLITALYTQKYRNSVDE